MDVVLKFQVFVVFLLLVFIFTPKNICAEETLQFERVRMVTDLSVAGVYRDNIYLENDNEKDDFVIRTVPALSLSAAFTENFHLTADYTLQFDHHSRMDNFRQDLHTGNIYFKYSSPKNSWITLGAKFEDGAKQPYSQYDESKDYKLYGIYSALDWNFNSMTAFEVGYEHTLRCFDEERYQDDDSIKDTFRLSSLFHKSQRLPLLIEYQFEKQLNNHLEPIKAELISHAILAGFRWRRERRLSGTVSFGHTWSEFNDMDAFHDWTTDTELLYRLGAFTEIKLEAQRSIRVSDSFARDVLDYYILSSIGASATYARFEPLQLSLMIDYQNREYFLALSKKSGRMDDLYRIAVLSEYQLKDWMAISLDYIHSLNQSDRGIFDYTDNMILIEIAFSM